MLTAHKAAVQRARACIPPVAALVLTLSACEVARAQWGFAPEPAGGCDLIVVGTLSDLEGGVAFAEGAAYDTTLGTLDVERVVYAREGAEVPRQVLLHSAQLSSLTCPRIRHEVHLHERGAWLLRRTGVVGVYSANSPEPVLDEERLKEEDARVRLVEAVLDPVSGIVELEVRFENFGPQCASFHAGLVLLVECRSIGDSDPVQHTVEVPLDEVAVSAWSFKRTTLQFALPGALEGCGGLHVQPFGDRFRGCGIGRLRATGSDRGPPAWLGPEATRVDLGYPSPVLLLLGVVLGALPLTSRGRTWCWRVRSEKLGTFLLASSLSLFPWSMLGLFTLPQLLAGARAQLPLVLFAFGFHALTIGVLGGRAKPSCRFFVCAGGLVPIALVLAASLGVLL